MRGIAESISRSGPGSIAGVNGGVEVLQLAVAMEQTGLDFYQALASACDDDAVASLCRRLAKEEEKHRLTFRKMLENVLGPGQGVRMTEEQMRAALRLAKSQTLPETAKVREVALSGKLKDALALAIGMEQDAILFYGRMRAFVPGADAALAAIIEEEKGHLRALTALAV